ncbi:MAG: M20 family metallopeptidase, partial [Ruminococcaceae bacterium]|nr:M20 family metallopeptidase [Oscillospiraceae bacterium]
MQRYLNLMQEAKTWIDAHREDLIRELQAWARIPSVSRADLSAPGMPFGPDCRKMLDFAMERGAAYGYQVQDHEGRACSITLGDPENAIGMIAHLDVVPVGDGWIYP